MIKVARGGRKIYVLDDKGSKAWMSGGSTRPGDDRLYWRAYTKGTEYKFDVLLDFRDLKATIKKAENGGASERIVEIGPFPSCSITFWLGLGSPQPQSDIEFQEVCDFLATAIAVSQKVRFGKDHADKIKFDFEKWSARDVARMVSAIPEWDDIEFEKGSVWRGRPNGVLH